MTVVLFLALVLPLTLHAQKRDLQYFRAPDQRGVNVFEAAKQSDPVKFDGMMVRLGGASTIQFQGISHENTADERLNGDDVNLNELADIGANFNLATANMTFDVQLNDGMRMHLTTYLSSRHHSEAWVKGGYIQFDGLPFFNSDAVDNLMKSFRVKIGHMEVNYGDAHFRRSDNGMTMFNPLVGNYIMDSFTTEVAGELYYLNNGVIVMAGLTNGKLNQSVKNSGSTNPSIIGKLGYDKQINEDLRVRITGSVYHAGKTGHAYLYSGDRAGSRYYYVMENTLSSSSSQFRSGRYDPGFSNKLTSIMLNPFVKYQGFEFFGMFETSSGSATSEDADRRWNQLSGELTYRLGDKENIYVVARYTKASGEEKGTLNDVEITRLQAGAGWFMTKNVLAKLEYVNQSYDGFDSSHIFSGGSYHGVMVEAAITF
ncbi:MAG: hypothetical protein E2O84_03775 [Bacteroidetes bacterium]|nr:MAG: hypothetical protein E2O84_03775 [Bacteroidota bacterium]